MHKILHRLFTAILGFLMFATIAYVIYAYDIATFFGFIIGLPVIIIPIVLFLKVPFKCDQKGCNGMARLVTYSAFDEKWFRHLFVTGHRCDTCKHFIRLPKTSTPYDNGL